MSPVIRWEEPPAQVSSERALVLRELQQRAGEWALVQTGIKSTSASAQWKKLGCESQQRRQQDGTHHVWARWPKSQATPKMPQAQGGIIRPAAEEPKDRVQVTVNGVPTGKYVERGTSPKTALGGGYMAGRAARGVPKDGYPV